MDNKENVPVERRIVEYATKEKELQAELDDVTRMLRSVMVLVKREGREVEVLSLVRGLAKWLSEHHKKDEVRKAQVFESAKNKLTPEEFDVLIEKFKSGELK